MKDSRRDFIKKTAAASAAISIGGILPGFSAKSYAGIMGANERIKVGIMGVRARGLALAKNYARLKNCEIISISDVEKNYMNKCIGVVDEIQGSKPEAIGDFRKALELKDMDAMVIATPDHWHAPATILACKAGKHVYVEKPCAHNPREGEMMVSAARKYNRKVQLGTQRPSWPNVQEALKSIHDGVIGRVYYAKGWYVNDRPSIGKGKWVSVPKDFNYDLWQGPAPREPYRDNIQPYNWHWFWNWGTGEAGNNATHFVDLMRRGMKCDYPSSVRSVGGRYCYDDDWQTPDTQVMTYQFPNDTMMDFESRSCNPRPIEGSSVGAEFYGTKGTLVLTGWNEYRLYDIDNKLLKDASNNAKEMIKGSTISPSQALDTLHIKNFLDGIRKGTPLNAEIEEGYKSTLLVLLGNIAHRAGDISFKTNPDNGHILDNDKAMKLWNRKYEPGWEPTI